MFKVLVGNRKRRVWSPTTIAVSVGAHVLLFGAVLTAGLNDTQAAPVERIVDLGPIPPDAPREVERTPPAPEPVRPNDVPVVPGRTIVIEPPTEVPDGVRPPNPDDKPLPEAHVTGIGPVGNTFDSTATARPTVRVPSGTPTPTAPTGPVEAREVDVLPDITNRSEIERFLRQHYPPLLRDAGVTGRVTVSLIIDETGRVEPGSVSVVTATSEGFRDASVKAAEKFRFRPARMGGRPVSVLIAVPIEWKLES
jgi:TonB family protein